MTSFSQFVKYQIKTCWGPVHWAGLAFALAFPVAFTPPALPESIPVGAYVLETTQVYLPLLGIAAMAGLVSGEYDAGTSETLLTTPFPRACLILTRWGLAFVYTVSLSAVVFGAYLARGGLTAVEAMLGCVSALVPAIYLGSLGFLAGLITRSTAPALLIPAGYWLIEVFTKGRYTGRLYLFGYEGLPSGLLPAKTPVLMLTLAILGGIVALFEARRN